LIGIKSEIVQCSEADCVGILVLRKRFTVPSDRVHYLSNGPRRAAVTLVVKRAVVCPARFLRRRVETDVADVYSRRERNTKGLNAAIQVLVIQGVLIVPDALRRVGYFVTEEPDPVVARIGLVLGHGRAGTCPSLDRGLHSHGRGSSGK
jgi:hypothetical protein